MADGWYHVLSRAVEHRQIFPDERSNLRFLELLGCLPSRSGVRSHGAIARIQKRLKIDRELQKKLKKVAKTLRIEI